MGLSDYMSEKPVRSFLRERETLIPRKKLVEFLEGPALLGQELPPGVSPEAAIETVSNSAWAHNLAEGVCGPKYAGFAPGTPEFLTCVHNVSHRVAARVLGLTWSPVSMPPARAKRR